MTFLWALLGFVVAMGLLVAIHEWGHFIVAKLFNIKVVQFSVGFGKPLVAKQWGETQYRIGLIPLGGYVKFLDEREGDVAEADRSRAFNRQPVFKRFAVVLAGPLINLVFAWWLFSSMYWIGVPGLKPIFTPVSDSAVAMQLEALEGLSNPQSLSSTLKNSANDQAWQILKFNTQSVTSWREVHQALVGALVEREAFATLTVAPLMSAGESAIHSSQIQFITVPLDALKLENTQQDWISELGVRPSGPKLPVIVGEVVAGSPAAEAGFQSGDKILRAGGQRMERWESFVEWVREHPGQTVILSVRRNGVDFDQSVTLDSVNSDGVDTGRFGAALHFEPEQWDAYRTQVQYSLIDALQKGWTHAGELIDMSLIMLKRMIFGEASIKNLSGPITIADVSGQALQNGVISFISLLGLLSLSLGILNLLPIPMLDGGHLLFYLIEMVRGVPLSESMEGLAQRVGLMIILSLTFIALFNDVVRITDG